MPKARTKKVSPIKTPPRRQAGESLGEWLNDYVYERAGVALAAVVFVWLFAFYEFIGWATDTPRRPGFAISFAVVTTIVGAIFIVFQIRSARRKSLGLQGERAVADELENLRACGCEVLHDIQAKQLGLEGDWNVDHVVIAPCGVFAIETKTRSKELNEQGKTGRTSVRYDSKNDVIRFSNGKYDAKPPKQAKANARHIYNAINKGRSQNDLLCKWVTPVVLYPGWFVRPHGLKRNARKGSVNLWVMNADYFCQVVDERSRKLKAGAVDTSAVRKRIAELVGPRS